MGLRELIIYYLIHHQSISYDYVNIKRFDKSHYETLVKC
jgi:hypothetical protein